SCWLRAKADWSPPATPNLQQPSAPCAITAISARTIRNGWAFMPALRECSPEWLGLNARMTEFNAALALRGLPLIDAKVRRRNSIAQTYTKILSSLPGARFQKIHSHDASTYKDYSIHITPEIVGMTRDVLAGALLKDNIE